MVRILSLHHGGGLFAACMLALGAWFAAPPDRAYAEEVPFCAGQVGPLCGEFKTCNAIPGTDFSLCVTTYYYRYALTLQ
jgi:hypothetical protein